MSDINDLKDSLAELRRETREWHDSHADKDDARFDQVNAGLNQLISARAEQVGAAKAIAELAERRAKWNTWIVSLITALGALLTLLIQKHWF